MLKESLSISGPDGQFQTILKKGQAAPAQARAVFATQRAGERTLAFRLFEGEGEKARLIGNFTAELPAGLPPNTWLSVFVDADAEHGLRLAVKENLRRINLTPECDEAGAKAKIYQVRS